MRRTHMIGTSTSFITHIGVISSSIRFDDVMMFPGVRESRRGRGRSPMNTHLMGTRCK